MAIILDGKKVASAIRENIKDKAIEIEKNTGRKPSLCIIQGGDRPDSNQYVKNKIKASTDNNIFAELIKISDKEDDYFGKLKEAVAHANRVYDGIIVQVPVPGISLEQQNELINMIEPNKDVDGMTSVCESKFYTDKSSIEHTCPCTPMGIKMILDYYNVALEGKKAVIIGRSNIVGRPLAHLMLTSNATVTVCHSKTYKDDIYDYVNNADIVVCAIGEAEFINTWDFQGIDWSNKVIIDVGTNKVGDEWFGDISQKIKQKSYAYTPVPGGVGPMTITSLLYNLVNKID